MRTQSPDTSPEAERVLIELLRRSPAWRRLQLTDSMSATVRKLCLAGLRSRHPQASEAELRRRFADLHLGPDLATKAFRSAAQRLMDDEQTQVNLLVVRAFEALGIPYFLGGSMASSVHGIYRATAAADFVAAVRPGHAKPLSDLFHPAFYADLQAIQTAVASCRSFNLIHLETMLKVDVFVARTDPFHQMQMRRRVLQPTDPEGRTTFYIASPEDTILAKLQWYRDGGRVSDRQWSDVLGVLKVQGTALDRAYLEDWARQLGVTDLLRRAVDEAGLPPAPEGGQ